ncbi:MAG: ROK family transcriptional regulator [Prolixibacteraceae bacterium]|nr:ROK family transcriptional regulator [Prolixibacteraceae bacterium]MBN2774393.1 ROK family transcriptional regulator [Prolixibacteraceae bacterium]
MKALFKNTQNQSYGIEQKKFNQKKQILKAIYFDGALANSDLAARLGLSTPKINSLLLELIDDGLVVDNGPGDSSGGRRPNIYGLVDNGFYVAGLTIGVHKTTISIFNSNNIEISGPHVYPENIQSGISVFSKINKRLNEVIKKTGIDRKKIITAGIEMPGLVNTFEGINKTYFSEINLYDELRKVFEFPVFFENDAKVRTFAEQHFGLAKGRENVLMVHMGWGVGLGIIIHGNLYSGNSGFAGEFGHMPIVDNGILCKCGKQGCLETIASATAIARLAKEGILAGNSSLLKGLVDKDIDKIETSTVIEAANSGDQFSISVLANVGQWLGKGIAYLIQIFNPELIIIGGRVADAGLFMKAPIEQSIHTYSNRDISNDTEINFSNLGSKAGVMGAAAYALERLANL